MSADLHDKARFLEALAGKLGDFSLIFDEEYAHPWWMMNLAGLSDNGIT